MWHAQNVVMGVFCVYHALRCAQGRATLARPVFSSLHLKPEEPNYGNGEGDFTLPDSYGYVERMNCCDVIVNPAHCGDIELAIIEAQSCGIPFVGVDDRGIMSEATGDGGLLIEPADVGYWKAGQRKYLISVDSLADSILALKEDSDMRSRLIEAGFRNARQYSWNRLAEAVIRAVNELEKTRHSVTAAGSSPARSEAQ